MIGIAAPLIIVFSRLLQGFSAGVELGGVSVYLAELATPGHKGFYVSWQSASQQAAVMFTALLGVVLGAILPVQAMELQQLRPWVSQGQFPVEEVNHRDLLT